MKSFGGLFTRVFLKNFFLRGEEFYKILTKETVFETKKTNKKEMNEQYNFPMNKDVLSCSIPKKSCHKSQEITRQKMIKNCEHLKLGNSSHHARFHCKRINISAT